MNLHRGHKAQEPTSEEAHTAVSRPLGKVHLLLTVQTVLLILISINRLSTWTLGYVSPTEFLRWVDLHNMLTLPMLVVVVLYLLKRQVEASSDGSTPPSVSNGGKSTQNNGLRSPLNSG